jgi:hypothetical protein
MTVLVDLSLFYWLDPVPAPQAEDCGAGLSPSDARRGEAPWRVLRQLEAASPAAMAS